MHVLRNKDVEEKMAQFVYYRSNFVEAYKQFLVGSFDDSDTACWWRVYLLTGTVIIIRLPKEITHTTLYSLSCHLSRL